MSARPQHPVRIIVTDDLRRSRLTVFFRFFIAIPHYIWAFLIGQAVAIVVFVNWFILLFKARTPAGLHNFVAGYLRYLTHLEAYFLLAANPFPAFYPFDGKKPYPVDLHIDPPERQNRWKVFFRLVLAIPAILITGTLMFGGPRSGIYFVGGLAFLVSFLAWFAAMVRSRVPRGMRDLLVFCLGYAAQASAYLFLITDRYPYAGPEAFIGRGEATSEPAPPTVWVLETVRTEGEQAVLTLVTHDAAGALAGRSASRVAAALAAGLTVGQPVPDEVLGIHAEPAAAPEPLPEPEPHPVSMTVTDELRRSRVLTFFRLPIATPHLVWLLLWAIVALLTLILAWLCALAIGRVPSPFHRFLSRYIRYGTHLYAFLSMVGNPFPGFVGKPGTYPVDLELPAPEHQKRLVIFFRFWLAIPAILISSGLYGALWTVAVLGWFVSLFLGRMPVGLRGLGAYALRYAGQVNAYLYLLTPRYPDSGPRPDPTSP